MKSNALKTAILLAAIGGLFVFLGRIFGGAAGMTIGLLIGLSFTGAMYWFSASMAIRAAGARELGPDELPWLRETVTELARRWEMPMPKLYIAPSPQPNAFATGRNPKHAAVAVTEGILGVLEPDELRAVLAHELGHVKNRDILVTSIAAAVGSAITWLVNIGMFFGSSDEDRPNPVVSILMMLLAPIAATILQLALSRSREFGADASGAELLGEGESLARALQKIEAWSKQVPMDIDPSHATAYIINPLAGFNVSRLFSTHPSTDDRVARLRGMFSSRHGHQH